jgi:hypothetical protein
METRLNPEIKLDNRRPPFVWWDFFKYANRHLFRFDASGFDILNALWRIVALLMIGPLFTGCYLAAPDPPLHRGMNPQYFEALIENGEKTLSKMGTNFTYIQAKDSELSVKSLSSKDETGETVADRTAALAEPLLLRFVWLSDVHMRQRDIKLGSQVFSNIMDEVISVTMFNQAQEDFHWAVYLSQIEAINALNRKDRVDFMIHTGDSVDTGSTEELYQFIYISNKLDIPWLNTVGNHDVTISGNFLPRLGYIRDPNVIFYPVYGVGDFIWMHRGKEQLQISGYGRHLLPVPKYSKYDSLSYISNKKLEATTHHGFDLGFGDIKCEVPQDICSYNRYDKAGDYATDLKGIPIPVRLIALNSAKKDGMFADGSIDHKQCSWLKDKLKPENGNINLVFFHHRPTNYPSYNEVKTLLANHGDGTLVAFTGHDHSYHISWHSGQNGRGFYELNTGSVLVYPQIGRVIELRGKPGGRVWLISRALWNNLMPVGKEDMLSDTARKEYEDMLSGTARKDYLDKCIKCTGEERDAIQNKIDEAVRCGHYGAYDDYLADRGRLRFWGKPQPFDKVWEEANVIIEITPQKRGE